MPKRDRTIFKQEEPVWKIQDMITRLDGVGGVTERLMAKGFLPPGPNTIQGWAKRNKLSGAWAPALFALAQDAGLIETPMDALIRDFRLEHKGSRK